MSTYTAKCDICGTENTVASYGDWACRQCGQGYTYDECHQIRLTDSQWALLRNQPRWIPVEERLPEERVKVLTCGDDPVEGPFILIGHREPASIFGPEHWHLPCFSEFGPVTHWQPLPSPPDEAT